MFVSIVKLNSTKPSFLISAPFSLFLYFLFFLFYILRIQFAIYSILFKSLFINRFYPPMPPLSFVVGQSPLMPQSRVAKGIKTRLHSRQGGEFLRCVYAKPKSLPYIYTHVCLHISIIILYIVKQ